MNLSLLNRSEEYYEALEKRLGFPVRDGKAELVHVSGVTFEDRQRVLAAVKLSCTFDCAPPAKLEVETDPKILKYDADAVRVLVACDRDDLTHDWYNYHVAGFLPRRRCPDCAKTYPGKRGQEIQICPECGYNMALGTDGYAWSVFNKRAKVWLNEGRELRVGVDNITEMQGGKGSLGCDIWIRFD